MPRTVSDLTPDVRFELECLTCRAKRVIHHGELPKHTTIERIKQNARCFGCGSKAPDVVVREVS